jgi:hypothetical protein
MITWQSPARARAIKSTATPTSGVADLSRHHCAAAAHRRHRLADVRNTVGASRRRARRDADAAPGIALLRKIHLSSDSRAPPQGSRFSTRSARGGTLRAVDQRREGSRWTRRSFAAKALRFQPSCAAIQPRQLHANHGDARGSGAVVPDEFAGEADQERRHGRCSKRS